MKKWKQCIGMITACVLTTTYVTGCSTVEDEVVKPDIVTVEAQTPIVGDMVLTNEFIGAIAPQEEVYVMSMVSAEVMENFVAVGDFVEEGDTLCKLDDKAAQLTLANANAAYDSAKAGVAQAQGAATQLQDLQTQSNINALEAQISSTEKTITDTNNDLKDTAENLEDAKEAADAAKKAVNKATKMYKTATTIATTWGTLQATYPTYAGKTISDAVVTETTIIATYEAETAQPMALTYTKEQYETAKTVVELASKMTKSGLTEASLTEAGIKALAETVTKAQTAYQSAATAEAQLEAQRKGYQQGVESAQEGLGTLKDNLETAKQTAAISQGQAREEQNAVYEAQLEAASVGIQSAQMQLDMYTLTAPISGTVEAVNVSEHGFATTGNPAYIISNKDSMTTTFSVSEGVRNTLAVGQKITVDKNGTIFEGNITEISAMVNAQTGLFTIKANVSATGDELLTGTKVKIITNTYNEKNTLIIPYDAVYYDNGQAYVYCVQEGLAKRVNVETGLFDATNISILSGVDAGTQVITTWSAGLKDGATVAVKETADMTEAVTEETSVAEETITAE